MATTSHLGSGAPHQLSGRQQDQLVLDDAIRQHLLMMTTDSKKLWNDPRTPNRERKQLLAYISKMPR